jgi:GNAT superfamily N-acetyltransferase
MGPAARTALIIRPVAVSDALLLAEIHAASWRDAYRGLLRDAYLDSEVVADRISVWSERMQHADPACFGFMAEMDGTPAGFVFLRGADDAQWGTLLDNIHVLPHFKGRGIGLRLIEAAARETARRHPGERVYLWVFEQNLRARRFYARLGGRDAERVVQPAPGGGTLPEWRVVWDNPAQLLAAVSRRP